MVAIRNGSGFWMTDGKPTGHQLPFGGQDVRFGATVARGIFVSPYPLVARP